MNEKILPVEYDDFIHLHQLEEKIFPSPYSMELMVNDFLNNPFSRYFKMVLGQTIIGYAAIWVIMEDAQIITLGIDPDYQGKGYGKAWMAFLIDYIEQQGCQRVTLEVRVSNHRARRLYESFGFKVVAVRRHYYENGEDAYLMLLSF